MRTVIGGIFLLWAGPALAQPVLPREPLTLNPFAVVYVQSGACGYGKVLKVVGSLRGVQRKRTCASIISARAEY
jgi:hypothetical protein